METFVGSYRGAWNERGGSGSVRLLPWVVGVAALAAIGFGMSATGAAGPVTSLAQRLAAPAVGAVHAVTAPVTGLVTSVGSAGRMRDENRQLRGENERLRVELAGLREDEARAGELADLLNIGRMTGGQVVYAAIIARDPAPLRDLVAINRGGRDGVRAGLPVLGKGGALAGTVERATDSMAWVRLLADPRSAVNAQVQESRALALAVGGPDRTVRMEQLAQDAVVKPGDTVVTSGLGGAYPKGLLIGAVARVDGGALEVFKQVQIEPVVHAGSLESVAVLIGFQPTPIEGLNR